MGGENGNSPSGDDGPVGRHNKSNQAAMGHASRAKSRADARSAAKSAAGGRDQTHRPKPKAPKAVKATPVASVKNLLSSEAIKKAEANDDMRQRQMRQQNQDKAAPKVNLLGDGAPVTLSISSID